ncbi:TadE/TadG family type IV pilus assembly protein [Saccharopolyspora cebuensis]|uniref:TadE/TadG family type IV pilus assembly protein n=1 Tax=Saccharopolyspora cebuensis TaxID=418759 RepID=UPI0031EFB7C9
MTHGEADEGSASVELAVLTPVVLAVLALMVAAGRIVTAHAALDTATAAAARATSLARTAPAAHTTASTVATQTVHDQGLHCQHTQLAVDTSGLTTPVGQTGTVSVDLTCTVALADLALPGMPGTVDLHSAFASPVDPYRGRS